MLKVKDINVYYGKIHALKNVSFEVRPGEVVALIGANGAGKSTTLKTVSGMMHSRTGSIEFLGEDITHTPSHNLVYKGLAHVPEGRRIFQQMTVLENLEMGAFSKKYSKGEMADHVAEVYDLFPRLKERSKQAAGTMSGGEQQMLAIGRGMMSNPKLLMFDEPSLGLAPVIVDEMFRAIIHINEMKKTPIVIAEQNAFMAMGISNRTYVLEVGHVVNHGKSSVLLDSPEIKKAYLGG